MVESISEIYYKLGKYKWIFQIVLFLVGALSLPILFSKTSPDYQFLPFIVCFCIMLVSIAPQFELRLEGFVHYGSAIICGVCSIVWMFLQGYINIVLYSAIPTLILILFNRTKYVWWIECWLILCMLYCIIN